MGHCSDLHVKDNRKSYKILRDSYLSSHYKDVDDGHCIPRKAIVGLKKDGDGILSLITHLLLIRANMLGNLESY